MKMPRQWPARLEIARSLVPMDKWHWCVVLNGGHIFSASEISFDSVEDCMIDASTNGVEKFKMAENALKNGLISISL